MIGVVRGEEYEYDLEPILIAMYSAVVLCGSTMANADIADMANDRGSGGPVLIL